MSLTAAVETQPGHGQIHPNSSTGEPELTYVPGGFPLSQGGLTTKTLTSLFTKEPTTENNIDGQMQLEVPELPSGHDSTWVRGCC